jgi:glycerophosphoryl diester phosphodiesterase
MINLKRSLLILLTFTTLSSSAAPYCVAHRALGFGELENSYAAIEAAAKSGAKAIEFDLLHTKDNETVIYHDDELERLVEKSLDCPIGAKISAINTEQLSNCKLSNGETVPTFSETMEMLSNYDSTLFIELKDKFTDKDLSTIMETFPNRSNKIVIISFNQSVLKKIKSLRETQPYLKDVKLVLVKKTAFRANTSTFDGFDTSVISKRKVKKLKKQGKLVGVYTKNKTKSIKKAIKKGVDFITTNEYELCQSLID